MNLLTTHHLQSYGVEAPVASPSTCLAAIFSRLNSQYGPLPRAEATTAGEHDLVLFSIAADLTTVAAAMMGSDQQAGPRKVTLPSDLSQSCTQLLLTFEHTSLVPSLEEMPLETDKQEAPMEGASTEAYASVLEDSLVERILQERGVDVHHPSASPPCEGVCAERCDMATRLRSAGITFARLQKLSEASLPNSGGAWILALKCSSTVGGTAATSPMEADEELLTLGALLDVVFGQIMPLTLQGDGPQLQLWLDLQALDTSAVRLHTSFQVLATQMLVAFPWMKIIHVTPPTHRPSSQGETMMGTEATSAVPASMDEPEDVSTHPLPSDVPLEREPDHGDAAIVSIHVATSTEVSFLLQSWPVVPPPVVPKSASDLDDVPLYQLHEAAHGIDVSLSSSSDDDVPIFRDPKLVSLPIKSVPSRPHRTPSAPTSMTCLDLSSSSSDDEVPIFRDPKLVSVDGFQPLPHSMACLFIEVPAVEMFEYQLREAHSTLRYLLTVWSGIHIGGHTNSCLFVPAERRLIVLLVRDDAQVYGLLRCWARFAHHDFCMVAPVFVVGPSIKKGATSSSSSGPCGSTAGANDINSPEAANLLSLTIQHICSSFRICALASHAVCPTKLGKRAFRSAAGILPSHIYGSSRTCIKHLHRKARWMWKSSDRKRKLGAVEPSIDERRESLFRTLSRWNGLAKALLRTPRRPAVAVMSIPGKLVDCVYGLVRPVLSNEGCLATYNPRDRERTQSVPPCTIASSTRALLVSSLRTFFTKEVFDTAVNVLQTSQGDYVTDYSCKTMGYLKFLLSGTVRRYVQVSVLLNMEILWRMEINNFPLLLPIDGKDASTSILSSMTCTCQPRCSERIPRTMSGMKCCRHMAQLLFFFLTQQPWEEMRSPSSCSPVKFRQRRENNQSQPKKKRTEAAEAGPSSPSPAPPSSRSSSSSSSSSPSSSSSSSSSQSQEQEDAWLMSEG